MPSPRSPRSPRSYHESMLASSSLLSSSSSKSKQHANFWNDPNHHHDPTYSHNHELEKIKMIVNYSENGSVKTRTTRLIEDDTSYLRRDDKFESRKMGSSKICTPPRVVPSPSPSPPPITNYHHHHHHHLHAQNRPQQGFKQENINRRESYHREAYAKRSRTRSRSRTPPSKK